jgi:RNA polymerase sigma-70 factor, ECF subfamily
MRLTLVDAVVVRRLYERAKAERWNLPIDVLAEALQTSAERAFGPQGAPPGELQRYLESLHLEDLAVACACAEGSDQAWEQFVREHRPILYRAADALDPSGSARELADSLYADLFGLTDRGAGRQSLFRYFHGRSSLATWLRSVLAQRHVDLIRGRRRTEPLPEEGDPRVAPPSARVAPDHEDRVAVIERSLRQAVQRLGSRDRLRLASYYAHDLTLAQVGRLLGEHEATSSRQLARTRRTLRKDVEQLLRNEGLGTAQIDEYLAAVVDDAGTMDLERVLDTETVGKESVPDRSIGLGREGGRRGH